MQAPSLRSQVAALQHDAAERGYNASRALLLAVHPEE